MPIGDPVPRINLPMSYVQNATLPADVYRSGYSGDAQRIIEKQAEIIETNYARIKIMEEERVGLLTRNHERVVQFRVGKYWILRLEGQHHFNGGLPEVILVKILGFTMQVSSATMGAAPTRPIPPVLKPLFGTTGEARIGAGDLNNVILTLLMDDTNEMGK